MMKFGRVKPNDYVLFPVEEGVETSCMIPIPEEMKVEVYIKSPKEVRLHWIDVHGETFPLTYGGDVNYKGRLEAGSVEIVASSSFWYLCRRSRVFELVDPTPMAVELVQTQQDVLKTMIEERLRRYTVAQELNRPLTEDEKDALVLDIANGDLEFDDEPDQFGLGYEERLAEFIAKHKEEEEPPAPPPVGSVSPEAPKSPAAGSNSSST